MIDQNQPFQKLSVIVLSKNNEKTIQNCLKSLDFADEVILTDSGSTDKTLNIAKKFSNVTVLTTEWLGYSKTKDLAVSKTKNDWVLWLDSDEYVSEELKKEWKYIAQRKILNSIGAFSILRRTFFLGRVVKQRDWYRERLIRFFHKNRAIFNNRVVHEGLILKDAYKVKNLNSWIFHESYDSLSHYYKKMLTYGELGGLEIAQSGKKISILRLFFSPCWAFFKSFILQKGFLDGLTGYTVCTGKAFYTFIKYSHYFFSKKSNT